MNCPQLESSLERLFTTVSQPTAEILDRALSGHDITVDEAARLFDADGSDLFAIIAAADALRARTVGDVVTYVINRNINFTNVCVKACGFCAFSRGHLAEEGYFLPVEEVIRRAKEARELGATEVCVQAGLAPGIDGWHYVNLCRALKEALPDIHIHGFSPEEVLYGSSADRRHRSRLSPRAEGSGGRQSARNFGGSFSRCNPPAGFTGPDRHCAMDRADPNRARDRHSNYLDDHVRLYRKRAR